VFNRRGDTLIITGTIEAREATRKLIRSGASQIKIMVGGGVASDYDPLYADTISEDEIRAIVDAAADYGTYVIAYAYHDRSVNRAIDGGIMMIEHGFLISEKTVDRFVKEDIVLSVQAQASLETFGNLDAIDFFTPDQKEKGRRVNEGAKQMLTWAVENGDGTGELTAWGDTFPRNWHVEGEDRVCIQVGREENCVSLEKSVDQENTYRATVNRTGESVVFTVLPAGQPIVVDADTKGAGGATEPSADEIAESLANPNTPLASQTFRIQYRLFQGDLPDVDEQDGTLVLYQPAFPFPLENGATVFFRPATPLIFDQPYFDAAEGDFESLDGIGDIGFDLAYGRTTSTGLLWAMGMISTLPTATQDKLGQDRWTLGPELLVGKLTKSYVVGALTTHQWDIGGSGDADINLTTVNALATFLPGGGWNVGTAPIMSYDHENNQWTLPINLSFGNTVIWRGRPWKLGAEINYFVDQPDAFGPEWMFGINIAPVVENVFAGLFN
jgi:hypothetical protein